MWACEHQSNEKAQHSTGACTSARRITGAEQSEEERHYDVSYDDPFKVATKIRFRPQKRSHFAVHIMHQGGVPKEAEREEKDEGSDEGDEKFLPVHKLLS